MGELSDCCGSRTIYETCCSESAPIAAPTVYVSTVLQYAKTVYRRRSFKKGYTLKLCSGAPKGDNIGN